MQAFIVIICCAAALLSIALIIYRIEKAEAKRIAGALEYFQSLPQSEKDAWAKDMLKRIKQQGERH